MTTIAASRKEMACDSRASGDDGEYHNCDDKVERIGGDLVGCAGDWEDIYAFLAWFKDQSKERPEIENCLALVLNRKGLWLYANTTYPSKVAEPFFAIGTGSMAARAAMKWGASPQQAISTAITLDKNSGGRVRVYSLKE